MKESSPIRMTRNHAYLLFLCHSLSTWNARTYEFASVLFTATAYPDGLGAVSLIGMTTSLAVIFFASSLGRWIDHAPSRLQTLLTTVAVNRCAAVAACFCWTLILSGTPQALAPSDERVSAALVPKSSQTFLFTLIIFLGILERLSRLANLVSIERDWVPTLAPPLADSSEISENFDLTHLNAVMGRIDLICKLASPIAISLLMSAIVSPRVGALGVLGLNLLSWPLENWSARKIWDGNTRLREGKGSDDSLSDGRALVMDHQGSTGIGSEQKPERSRSQRILSSLAGIPCQVYTWVQDYKSSLQRYFSTTVWMPSLALSSLHFSVLTYSATLTVYLLNSGFSLEFITTGRILSSIFELSSTFVYPWGVRKFSAISRSYQLTNLSKEDVDGVMSESQSIDEDEDEKTQGQDTSVGVSRLGFWALFQMFLCLTPVVPAIWQLSNSPIQEQSAKSAPQFSSWQIRPFVAISLLLFVSASRLGRWTNHLTTQQLAQSRVSADHCSSFAGTETSVSSMFGLGHWIATALFSRHEDFKWLALGSLVVVAGSIILYGFWMLKERGHSIHLGRSRTRGSYRALG